MDSSLASFFYGEGESFIFIALFAIWLIALLRLFPMDLSSTRSS